MKAPCPFCEQLHSRPKFCTDCNRKINDNEEMYAQDRTGNIICEDCSDYHQDITRMMSDSERQECPA